MTSEDLVSHSPEETGEVGARLALRLGGGGVVWLVGPLGAGKTLLAKGLFAALGADPTRVTSPTFTLVNRYRSAHTGVPELWHVDLYRAERPGDLETLGLEEILDSGAVVVIEWGERLGAAWGNPDVVVAIEDHGGDTRRIRIETR